MSKLQNCSVMCAKNGSYCENEKREKKSGERGMCTKNGSYCEKEKKERKSQGRGGCVQRMEVIVKRKKKREKVRGEGNVYKEWKLL